jgi:hypothetical protein
MRAGRWMWSVDVEREREGGMRLGSVWENG